MKSFSKFGLITCCLGLVNSGVIAADSKIGLEFKSAYEINDSDDNGAFTSGLRANANNELESRRFNVQYAALSFGGTVNDSVSFFSKLNLNTAYNAGNGFGVSDAISEVFATYTFNEMYKLDFGKMFLFAGGHEGYALPSDVYHTTLASSNVPFEETGARLNIETHGQKFLVSLTNAGKEANQKNPMFGLVWMGDLLDGVLTPNVSYFHKPHPKQSGSPSGVANADKRDDTYLALALQAHLLDKKLTLEGQYGMNEEEKATAGKDDSINSWHAKMAYRHERFKPFFQFESSEQESGGADLLDRTGWAAGLEYFPMDDENFRFHLVYWTTEDEYKQAVAAGVDTPSRTNGQDVETSQLLLGLNFNI